MSERPGAELFESQLDSWHAWQQTPWGRIRYRVVGGTLRRTCTALGSAPLKILDVGGGNGSDALPLAESGHDVTVFDYSTALLDEARARGAERRSAGRLATVQGDVADLGSCGLEAFDLVLCHNVVQYQPDTARLVQSLATLVRPPGAVSLMAVNPASDVLTAVVRDGDLGQAAKMLTAPVARARTFDHDVRRVPAAEAEQALAECGFAVERRYGIRVLVDYIADDARKGDPHFYQQLEELELAVCDQPEYFGVARLWQLVARRKERAR